MRAGKPLHARRIASMLPPGTVIGHRIEVRERVSSTNDEVAALARLGEPAGVVVAAEWQERGRGRRGTRWISPPGKDLLFSVLLRPAGSPETWSWLVHGAAVAVCRVIEAAVAIPAGIKWPNDVHLPRNRKVAGILMETTVRAGHKGGGCAVLGIGVNVNGGDFPPDIQGRAACLREAAGAGEIDRERLLADLLGELDAICALEGPERAAVLREADRRSVLHGRTIAVGEGTERVTGRFAGIGEGGELRLLEGTGTERTFPAAQHVELMDEEIGGIRYSDENKQVFPYL